MDLNKKATGSQSTSTGTGSAAMAPSVAYPSAAYKSAYERGWRASSRGSITALENADLRNEVNAWYDGYLDFAAGREKWHIPRCADHDSCGKPDSSAWHATRAPAAAVILDPDGDPMEYAVTVPRMYADGPESVIRIGISKVGGGTLGESYSGSWSYVITCGATVVISGSDFSCGMPHNHEYTARQVADYFGAVGESLYLSNFPSHGESEHSGEYDESQTAFLVAEYERLSAYAEDGK